MGREFWTGDEDCFTTCSAVAAATRASVMLKWLSYSLQRWVVLVILKTNET